MDELTIAEAESMSNLLRLRNVLEDAKRRVAETAEYAAEAIAAEAEVRAAYEKAVIDWRATK